MPTYLWTFTPPHEQQSLSSFLITVISPFHISSVAHTPTLSISQDLELWISSFGEAGFIVVTLGSMVSSVSVDPLLVELVAGFSMIPQGVLWR